jgi:hypothetical protein
MEKQRECANRNKENILSVLTKTLVVFLLLVMAIGCRSIDKHIPLSAELAIAPADAYQSVTDRKLCLKYYGNLENIYQKVSGTVPGK